MENSFKKVVDEANSILILLPENPYFSQVAAALSLYLSLKNDGKNVSVYSPSQMTVEFNRLIGVNKIKTQLGNKNLLIDFENYNAKNIERVSYDIEDGQFRLTVIPKEGQNPPQENQIKMTFSGVSADTAILVGGANESHFPALSSKEIKNAKLVHVGTKNLTTSSDNKVISFSTSASSASEVVANLLKQNNYTLDEDISTNLLMGIEKGSEGFSSEGVGPQTFELAAELMKSGGKREGLAAGQQPKTQLPPGAIPGQTPQQQQQAQVQSQPPVGEQEGQQQVQQQQQAQVNSQQTSGDKQESGQDAKKDVPQDWLKPRIYKGTSLE